MRTKFACTVFVATLLVPFTVLCSQEGPKPKVIRVEREPADGFINRGGTASFIAYLQNADSVEYRLYAVGCGGCLEVFMGKYVYPLEGRVRHRFDLSFKAAHDPTGYSLREGSWYIDVVAIRWVPDKKGEYKRRTAWQRLYFMVR